MSAGTRSHESIVSRIGHAGSTKAPRKLRRWWNELDPSFWRSELSFELPLSQRMQVALTAAGDLVTRTAAATLLGATALPFGFSPARIRDLEAEGEAYARFLDEDPARTFRAPEHGVRVTRTKARWPHFAPSGGSCEDLRFDSAYTPLVAAYAKGYLANAKNRVAHARHWFHGGGPRPTVIAIHGFTADLYALNEWFFALPWLYELGCDVLLFTMPFHGQRSSTLAPFSGHGFFSGGIAGINEAFLQAVHDFRVFMDHLMIVRGVETVGVTGVSLGGYTSALLAAVEPRLAFSVPNVPLVSVADLALEWHPVSELIRAVMRIKGLPVQTLRRWLALTSPLSYTPLLPKERLMIIGGVADRLAPPKHSRELWEHWDRCRIHWYCGSHLLHLDRGEYLREIAKFFGGISVLDKTKRRRKKRR
ncbi:MAG: alpha/beta hydrolase [Deltaproteobacteria bacterium]|nr:alpha/beta hydrolase [Deltaproteobacteria bacterium]